MWCCDVQCYADTKHKMNSICRHLWRAWHSSVFRYILYTKLSLFKGIRQWRLWDDDNDDVVDCRKHYKCRWFEMEQKWLKISVYFLVFLKESRINEHKTMNKWTRFVARCMSLFKSECNIHIYFIALPVSIPWTMSTTHQMNNAHIGTFFSPNQVRLTEMKHQNMFARAKCTTTAHTTSAPMIIWDNVYAYNKLTCSFLTIRKI